MRAAIAQLDGFRSTQDIYTQMRAGGDHVGLSTIYRHLQRLAEQGVVDAIHTASGETLYRYCRRDAADDECHHHHLVCSKCGHTEPIEGKEIQEWVHHMARRHGYTQTQHTVEIFGLCKSCADHDSP